VSDFPTVIFEAGQRIFNAGEAADHLYFIQEGIVQLLDAQGNAFAQISKGESFGEQAFLNGGIRGASAQALNDVSCIQISSVWGGPSPKPQFPPKTGVKSQVKTGVTPIWWKL
jgi:CRP-like cAMP-binding protein